GPHPSWVLTGAVSSTAPWGTVSSTVPRRALGLIHPSPSHVGLIHPRAERGSHPPVRSAPGVGTGRPFRGRRRTDAGRVSHHRSSPIGRGRRLRRPIVHVRVTSTPSSSRRSVTPGRLSSTA